MSKTWKSKRRLQVYERVRIKAINWFIFLGHRVSLHKYVTPVAAPKKSSNKLCREWKMNKSDDRWHADITTSLLNRLMSTKHHPRSYLWVNATTPPPSGGKTSWCDVMKQWRDQQLTHVSWEAYDNRDQGVTATFARYLPLTTVGNWSRSIAVPAESVTIISPVRLSKRWMGVRDDEQVGCHLLID